MIERLSKIHLLYWLWIVPLLLLTTGLISQHLLTDVYWFDELANLRKMGVPPYPPAGIIDMIANVGVTKWPPAYNFVLLFWGQMVGWSEFATRTLSLFMGVLSVAMMYRLGKSLNGQRTGFISAILLATSVFFLHYAHEMRGYIQYTFLTITILYLYWHHRSKSHLTGRDRIGFVITGIILIYTHYVALFVVFGIGVYHLLLAPRKNHWGKRLRWLIYIGIAYLPWSLIAVLNAIGETVKQRGLDPHIILQTIVYGFSNGLWFILVALIIYAVIFLRNERARYLLFTGAILLIAALITNVFTDFLFHIRHLIGFLPIIIVTSALAINHLISLTRGLAWGLVLVWMIAGVWLNQDLMFMDNLPGAMENRPLEIFNDVQNIINTCISEDDFLITHLPTEQNIWNVYVEQYYWWQPDFTVAMLDTMVDYSTALPDDIIIEGTYESRLVSYLENTNRTWVVVADDAYQTPVKLDVSDVLSKQYAYCGQVSLSQSVTTYAYQNTSDFICNTNAQTLPTCAPDLLIDQFNGE